MSELETWSTDSLPEELRFTGWSEKMRALHLDWNLTSPVEAGYAARIRYRLTGNAQVADVRCTAFGGQHEPSAGTPDVVGIQLQLAGRMTCTYGSEQFTIVPGDIFIWGSDLGGAFRSDGQHRQLSVLVPRARVPQSVSAALAGSRPLSARPGTGMISIAAGQIRSVAREMDHLSDDAVSRTVTGLLDLVDAAVAPVRATGTGQHAALQASAQRYVLERLDDRSMSVSSIAAAQGVSVRTLHLAFAEAGTSVGRWTRQQRLERCRRDLSGASGSTTVTDVAFRWGFSDAAHFSRVFKQEFGVPPTAVMPRGRRQQLPA